MSISHSSQGFVRALKAPSDPPISGGPLKIDIARRAWDDTSFHVPNKPEIITDWILNKFLKEKQKQLLENPLVDPQYWNLLYKVLSLTSTSTPGIASRPLQAWLSTILGHVPIVPILTRFLNLLEGLDYNLQNELSEVFSSCFGIIWPLAVQKIGAETLLECFGALLNALSLCEKNEGFRRIGRMIISSYKTSLGNSSNKKKISNVFLQTHLNSWLVWSSTRTQSDSYRSLLEAIYDAGIDTLLNIDILRQMRDSKSENTLFEAIATTLSSNPAILDILPRIFSSYIHLVKKYRGSLFGQGSNVLPGMATDDSNAYGMKIFMACNSLLDNASPNAQVWSTRVGLLSLVDQENIFSREQIEALLVLNELAELALKSLEDNENGRDLAVLTHAVDSLSALARIDYNIVLPIFPRILSAILMHESSPAHLNFLDLLLNYHAKTRTMDAYVISLLSTLSPPSKFMAFNAASTVYQRCHSGPLMNTSHLDSLSRVFYGFLSSTQSRSLVDLVAGSLSQSLERLRDVKDISNDEDEPPRKKKKSTGGFTSASQMDYMAIEASLSIRLLSIVISSLPLGSVPENTRQDILQVLSNIRNTSIPRALTKVFRRIRKTEGDSLWGFQITAAALLRLRYVLDTLRHISPDYRDDPKLFSAAQKVLGLDGLMPELRIEIFRALLGSTRVRDPVDSQAVIGHIIRYLAENLEASEAYWSGNSYQLPLDERSTMGSLALLHMMFERWLPIIESVATSTQLGSLFQHIIQIHLHGPQPPKAPGLNKSSLFQQIFQSAQLWEQPNIRNTFLAFITNATLALDNINDAAQLPQALSVYQMLLFFPIEYIPRSHRTELTKRAITADLFITQLLKKQDDITDSTLQGLKILRTFLNRVFLSNGFTEQPVREIGNLSKCVMMAADSARLHHDVELLSVTIRLMGLLISDLLSKSTLSNPDALSTTLTFLETIQDNLSESTSFSYRCAIQMIGVLEESFSLASFPQEIQASLRSFHHKITSSTLPQLRDLFNAGILVELLDHQSGICEMWCALLTFGRWLGLTENLIPRLDKAFLVEIIKTSTKILPNPNRRETLVATALSILLKEMYYMEEVDVVSHLNLITASYLSFSEILGASGLERLNNSLSNFCKTLTPLHYLHILDIVKEELTAVDTTEDLLARLTGFSILLLNNHPQGTLKYTQIHAAGCLNVFIARNCFVEGQVWLRLQALEFIVQHCSIRPANLKIGDINNIWSLLAKLLSGSQVHDEETATSIFHKIVTIISALVRFRRDLVMLTIPHLGVVLRQLLMSIRSLRPLLGSKQTSLVADTLPRWVNPRTPLGVEEAKILARLLETLITKNIVRSNATIAEGQKAESLAKPFSKHASYVLKAYIEAMNDPLCVLGSELRKELQRGLYALCSMVSSHNRDAIMLSALDSGGRATMKALWKEYEKQKYVGKG